MAIQQQCLNCRNAAGNNMCSIKGQYLTFDGTSCKQYSSRTNEEVVKQIYDYATTLLYEQECSKNEAIEQLITDGVDSENATIIVENIIAIRKKRAVKKMLGGIFVSIIGIIVSIVGSIMLSKYIILYYGLVTLGVLMFIQGVFLYLGYDINLTSNE